jgi:hypothetical protein
MLTRLSLAGRFRLDVNMYSRKKQEVFTYRIVQL